MKKLAALVIIVLFAVTMTEPGAHAAGKDKKKKQKRMKQAAAASAIASSAQAPCPKNENRVRFIPKHCRKKGGGMTLEQFCKENPREQKCLGFQEYKKSSKGVTQGSQSSEIKGNATPSKPKNIQ